jgi:thiamine biosynthesis lipoprotein
MTTFKAMNTTFFLAGLNQENTGKIQNMIAYAEKTFSRFNPNSEISHINQRRQHWVQISPLTFALLTDAMRAYHKTQGIFNPFLGNTIQELGYDQSFETLAPTAKAALEDQLHSTPDLVPPTEDHLPSYLEFDTKACRVRLAATVSLDLGGIGKGWIAQYASNQLQLCGVKHGLIDAGGDIILWGQEPKQGVWGIGVANPFHHDKDIASLWLTGQVGIATSSIHKRQWRTSSHEQVHHIIDPRTNKASNSDLIQVTILSSHLLIAEEYAKCLLILGTKIGFPWLMKQEPQLAYIAIKKDGTILASTNINHYCLEMEVFSHVHCCH